MAKPTALIRNVLERYGLDADTSCWDCHGSMVIYHKACQIIAMQAGIEFGMPTIVHSDPEKKSVVILVEGVMPVGDAHRRMWSFGEATPANNKNSYPFAMAEKRAKDRVILGLAGIHGYVYSESEAEEFATSAPKGNGTAAVREAMKEQMKPEETDEKTDTVTPFTDWVAELNVALMACGCDSKELADQVCVWLWNGNVDGVDKCRNDQDTARDTIYRLDEKRDQGLDQSEFLSESASFVGVT